MTEESKQAQLISYPPINEEYKVKTWNKLDEEVIEAWERNVGKQIKFTNVKRTAHYMYRVWVCSRNEYVDFCYDDNDKYIVAGVTKCKRFLVARNKNNVPCLFFSINLCTGCPDISLRTLLAWGLEDVFVTSF